MNKIVKMLAIAVIIASIFLSACAPPPPPVTKDQLSQAKQDMIKAKKEANELKVQRDNLQKQVNEEKAKLQKLKDYQTELGM